MPCAARGHAIREAVDYARRRFKPSQISPILRTAPGLELVFEQTSGTKMHVSTRSIRRPQRLELTLPGLDPGYAA
ncbi:MAG: hypothetical protein AMXMBFR7_38890 [Planctomycetota bacterium]